MRNKIWQFSFITFFIWLLSQLFLWQPDLFFVALGLSVLMIVLTVRQIITQNSKFFWPWFIASPILFYLAATFYSAILANHYWIQLILAANAYILFVYFKNIYYHLAFGAPEREAKLRKVLLSASFLSFFAAAATLYALPIFLNLSFWSIFFIFIFLIALFFAQRLLLIPTGKNSDEVLFLGINTIVLTEISGALLLLPLNYNVRGLLLALMFYSLILFNNWRREARLNLKNLKWPLVIGISMILIILLSARWL